MKFKEIIILSLFALCLFTVWRCTTIKKEVDNFNLFPVSDDVKLGKQTSTEIAGNTKEYPILPEASNQEVYNYIKNIRDKILATGRVQYRNQFTWDIKIIKDDNTLNAFCTPGGHIYVYTGLIKYLDSEDQLAGVLGHEIAHAALRHSTRQMTKLYGVQMLTDYLLGKKDVVKQITQGIVGLQFSRSNEKEADEYSVSYLCGTQYKANGAAGFFKKIGAKGGSKVPEFLSTHPNPGNRVADIENRARKMQCKGDKSYATEYARIKSKL
ncbi:MAG: M48 family metalloprotease [Saprospiraceae bacterium]|nr:M48 family metalloprotease [Saprospiraceae bacterium]